ncbi:hypothetical protein K7432_009534 [Basidiobolus ranarum]|uniref:Uncharacterized protein n=1 Tax=Basidiobolus ranarum TaxID=34480 RepID=A0ABR2VWW1_9FUNG
MISFPPAVSKTHHVSGNPVGNNDLPVSNYYDLDLYPKLLREFENHRNHDQHQVLSTASPINYDLYPSLMREVENHGTQKQRDQLHDWEFRSTHKNWS